jgi:TonB family protein
MADLAAAANLIVLRRRSTGAPLSLDDALEIGAGGEARVLGVPGRDDLVAKLYRDPTLERARKLAVMLENPPRLDDGASLAWPLDLLTDLNGGRFAGFLMPRAEGPRVFEFYNPVSRRRTAPLSDWGLLHRAGANLAAAFDALHANGCVIGDVNESNILVSPTDGAVTLVDADSFQVRDPVTRTLFRSRVGKAEFTPPELQGVRFGEVDRAPEHDRFGLAVLVFLLLMEGTHPFACRFEADGEALPVEDRIRRGMFPYAPNAAGAKPPRMAPPFFTLHRELQALFLRAFVEGGADPQARPTPAEFRAALDTAAAELETCAENPRHRFTRGVPYCPWCHRAKLLRGRDPFPATVDIARAADATSLVVRRERPPWVHRTPVIPRGAPAAPAPAVPFHVNVAPTATPVPTLGARLAVLQAALPAWAQPALGPAALGNPLVWMPPAALTCLFGGSGVVRVIGMAVFFMALREVFNAGVARIRSVTMFTAAVLVVLWFLFSGLLGGLPMNGASNLAADAPAPGVSAGTPGADVSLPGTGADAGAAAEPVTVDGVAAAVLRNPHEMAFAIQQAYPPVLRQAGVTGTATVAVKVRPDGSVEPDGISVVQATVDAFGTAAAMVAPRIRFEPVSADGRPVSADQVVTIAFRPDPAAAPADAGVAGADAAPSSDAASDAAASPSDSSPADARVERASLRNAAEMAAILADAYPPALLDDGVEGRVMLRVRVHRDGTPDVASAEVQTATRPEFAKAAKSVVPRMRFTPGRVNGKAVPTWVVVPLDFHADE